MADLLCQRANAYIQRQLAHQIKHNTFEQMARMLRKWLEKTKLEFGNIVYMGPCVVFPWFVEYLTREVSISAEHIYGAYSVKVRQHIDALIDEDAAITSAWDGVRFIHTDIDTVGGVCDKITEQFGESALNEGTLFVLHNACNHLQSFQGQAASCAATLGVGDVMLMFQLEDEEDEVYVDWPF